MVVAAVIEHGPTSREAAKLFGVSHDSVWRWVQKREPDYWGI